MIDPSRENKKVQNWKNWNTFNTETMIQISEIKWNSVIMKDSWIRAILKVYWLNLDLKNLEEQQNAIMQYKRFLNWLDFPIQILVRSTYLDLTDYVELMRDNVSKLENDVLKEQWELHVDFLDEINSKQWLIFTKEFYLIVPYYPMENDVSSIRRPWWKKFLDSLEKSDSPDKIVQRYRAFLKNRKHLDTRVNLIVEWLRSLGIIAERLSDEQIISLLFKFYNPTAHKAQAE